MEPNTNTPIPSSTHTEDTQTHSCTLFEYTLNGYVCGSKMSKREMKKNLSLFILQRGEVTCEVRGTESECLTTSWMTAGERRVLCHTCGLMGAYMTHTHVYMDTTQHTHKTDTCKGTSCGYYTKHTHNINTPCWPSLSVCLPG